MHRLIPSLIFVIIFSQSVHAADWQRPHEKDTKKPASRRITTPIPIPECVPGVDDCHKSNPMATIRSHLGEIRGCYNKLLGKKPKAKGKIVLKWFVAPAGTVRNVNVIEDTVKEPEMTSCVKSKVQAWKFPKNSSDKDTPITYPFVFTPL